MLAYRVLAGSAPTYLNALVRANVTPRTLRSSSERRLALPSVQARQSRLFSFVAVLILAAFLDLVLVLVFRRKCILVLVTFSHFYPP